MENSKNIKKVELGNPIHLEEFVAVARYGAEVVFSEEYCRRVKRSRTLVEKWVEEERVMYGVTTGFGALCTKAIGKEETALICRPQLTTVEFDKKRLVRQAIEELYVQIIKGYILTKSGKISVKTIIRGSCN